MDLGEPKTSARDHLRAFALEFEDQMNVAERQASELKVHKWMGANGESIAPLKLSDPEMDVHGCYAVLVRREAFGQSIGAAAHQPPRQASK